MAMGPTLDLAPPSWPDHTYRSTVRGNHSTHDPDRQLRGLKDEATTREQSKGRATEVPVGTTENKPT